MPPVLGKKHVVSCSECDSNSINSQMSARLHACDDALIQDNDETYLLRKRLWSIQDGEIALLIVGLRSGRNRRRARCGPVIACSVDLRACIVNRCAAHCYTSRSEVDFCGIARCFWSTCERPFRSCGKIGALRPLPLPARLRDDDQSRAANFHQTDLLVMAALAAAGIRTRG